MNLTTRLAKRKQKFIAHFIKNSINDPQSAQMDTFLMAVSGHNARKICRYGCADWGPFLLCLWEKMDIRSSEKLDIAGNSPLTCPLLYHAWY
jgi:hypothetical protein